MNGYSVTKENHEIRTQSRTILTGNWGMAVLVVLVYGLITGISGSISGGFRGESGWFTGIFIALSALASFFSIAYTILVVNVLDYGFSVSFLKLAREKNVVFENLFIGFKDYGRIVSVMFLKNLLILLWTLLFIIPGIVKAYAYGMTEYIIADNPKMDALSAITKSKEMMYGWKGKLFLLDLSLIGWWFLCLFTCGIGFLWLGAYFKTNRANFYLELTGSKETESITEEPDDYVVEAAQKEIERINKEESDFS